MKTSDAPVLTPLRSGRYAICQGNAACGQATFLLTGLAGASTIALCDIHLRALSAEITHALLPHAVPEFPADGIATCTLCGAVAVATNATGTCALCQDHFDSSVS